MPLASVCARILIPSCSGTISPPSRVPIVAAPPASAPEMKFSSVVLSPTIASERRDTRLPGARRGRWLGRRTWRRGGLGRARRVALEARLARLIDRCTLGRSPLLPQLQSPSTKPRGIGHPGPEEPDARTVHYPSASTGPRLKAN